jgi:hypothetical protein
VGNARGTLGRVNLRQPDLGLAGLLLVVPASLLIAVGAGGAEPSLHALGPIVTFALPAVSMIAFWWDRWPGSLVNPAWTAPLDTILIALAAILLSGAGRLVTGPDIEDSMRLAVAAFVWMLHLTLVCQRWPLRGLPRLHAGLAALTIAWTLALISYFANVPSTLLLTITVWQTWFFIAWKGWPLAGRLVLANAVVLGGGLATYAALSGLKASVVSDVAGSFIASAFVVGVLFDGWMKSRAGTLAAIVAHVVIGRRWPFVPFDLEVAAN